MWEGRKEQKSKKKKKNHQSLCPTILQTPMQFPPISILIAVQCTILWIHFCLPWLTCLITSQLLTVAKNVVVNPLRKKFQCTSTNISLEEILRIFKTKHKYNCKGSCYQGLTDSSKRVGSLAPMWFTDLHAWPACWQQSSGT